MKFTKIISLTIASVFGLTALASCGAVGEPAKTDGTAVNYVTLRINPEIEMLTDEDGKVVAVNAVNEDAEVVLSVTELEGLTVEEAGVEFTQTAEELGYFDPENGKDTVYVGTHGENGENTEIAEKLNKTIADHFKNNGINGKVSPETLEKYAEKAAEWNISMGHTKLVMRVLDAYPELTDDDVLKLDVKGLMALLKGEKENKNIAVGLKDEYRAAVLALKEEYARAFELEKEMEALREKLEGEITEEEAAEINATLAAKLEEYEPLHNEYKEKLDALKAEYKESSEKARVEYKEKAEKKQKEQKENKNNKEDNANKENKNNKDNTENKGNNKNNNGKKAA